MAPDTDEIDPAMAEMMGFSSFGTAPKRRRLASPSATADAPRGTGANDVQLGERRQPAAAPDPAPASRWKEKKPDLRGGGLAAFLQHGQSMPARPAEAPKPVETPEPARREGIEHVGNGDGQGLDYRRGVRNARGDVAYFLPSFLEDPWKGLD